MTTTRDAIKKISADTGLTTEAVEKALIIAELDPTQKHLPILTRDAGRLVKQVRKNERLGREELAATDAACRAVEDAEQELARAKLARNRAIFTAVAAGARIEEVMRVSGLSRAWVNRIKLGENT